MARSRASSLASLDTIGAFAASSINYHAPYSDSSSMFQSTLQSFACTTEKKALLAALMDTAISSDKEEVTPNVLFLTIQTALDSLCNALENKLKNDEEPSKEVVPIVSLLELVRRIGGYLVAWDNNGGALFAHQFPTITQTVRLLSALSSSLPDPNTNQPGSSALTRQLFKTCTGLLLFHPTNTKEGNDLLNLILEGLEDIRPKVRKAAWTCLLEICRVAHETGNFELHEEMQQEDGEMEQKIDMKQRLLSTRRGKASKVFRFIHSILSSTSKKKRKNNSEKDHSKITHALRFLESAIEFCPNHEMQFQFGEDCLALLGDNCVQSVELVRQALVTLLSCLELGECDGMNAENRDVKGKFASRALAFLLQHRPSDSTVFVVYAKCLMGCLECMVMTHEQNASNAPPSKLLAFKLFPNIVKSMLYLCHYPEESPRSCDAEFNRLLSRMTPILVSGAYPQGGENNEQLHRVALETISQCLPILRQALQIQYRNGWGSILSGGYSTFITGLARAFLKLRGKEESGALQSQIKEMVLELLRLRQDVEKDGNARTAVEYATSTIIRGMGLELFMTLVDFLNEEDEQSNGLLSSNNATTTGGGIRDERAWLLPLLKQSTPIFASQTAVDIPMFNESLVTKTHLSFFQGRVLKVARRCDAASADEQRTVAEASIQKARVVELWALFPAFCLYPVDITENFANLAKTLVKALGDYTRYPKLIPIICGGLKTLTAGVMQRLEAKQAAESKQDYDILSNISTKILPSLFKLVENLIQNPTESSSSDPMDEDTPLSKQQQAYHQQHMQFVESVTDAIGYLARVCPRGFLHNLFKKVVQKLLTASTEVESIDKKEENHLRMCSLLGLAKSLVASGSLDDASLSLLFRAICPLVRTDEHDPRVQKRAYKVLTEICEHHSAFVTSSERLSGLMDLMLESILTAQVSVRHMRLKCMTLIVSAFQSSNQAHMDIIPKIMGEVLLCLKDSNAKTRDTAYKLLLAMATSRDDLTEFFKIILAALGAQTSHMRSAAVMALSRLVYEYAREDDTVQGLLPHLMETVAVLFDDSTREVNKSVIGFVRVTVAAMAPSRLEPLLPLIVDGVLKYNKGKDRFRQKIKIILKKLVRLYGYDVIAPLMPEKDARLITHMRKLAERAARRKAAGLHDGQTVAGRGGFDDLMESDESDSDDGRTFVTGATGFTKMTSMTGKSNSKRSTMNRSVISKSAKSTMTSKSIANNGPQITAELRGEVLDLLDSSKMAQSVRFADMSMRDGDSSDEDDNGDDEMHFDNQGRIVISGGLTEMRGSKVNADYDLDDDDENLELKLGGKRRRVSKFESVKAANAENDAVKSKKVKDKQRNSAQSLGAAYKSRKAGGDTIKKNQKFEPYAYVPLSGKDYTKKNREKAVSKMGTVVHSNKRKKR